MSNYIQTFENSLDAEQYKNEMLEDQIQLMWDYIGALEDVHTELKCMLNKYHDDNCMVCDKAYYVEEIVTYRKSVFHGCAISAGDSWVWQEVKK